MQQTKLNSLQRHFAKDHNNSSHSLACFTNIIIDNSNNAETHIYIMKQINLENHDYVLESKLHQSHPNIISKNFNAKLK